MQNLSLAVALARSFACPLAFTTRAASCFCFSSTSTHFNLHHYPYIFSCLLEQPICSFPPPLYYGSWWNFKADPSDSLKNSFPFSHSVSIPLFQYLIYSVIIVFLLSLSIPFFTIPLSFFLPSMKRNIIPVTWTSQ